MELLESTDPDKKKLIEASERHKREMEKEVKAISDKTEKMLINGLIIGGSLALTYFLVKQFGGSKKKKKSKGKKVKAIASEGAEAHDDDDDVIEAPSFISQIGTKVMNQATLILLDIAKEKLLEYLESRKESDENS